MKKILLFLVTFFCISSISIGQAPQAFKYQAVVLDTSGLIIANQQVSLRISIIEGDIYGEAVYCEIHNVTTNVYGIVSLEIGRGIVVEGEFDQIPWGQDSFFIKLEIDTEGVANYQLLGISQLLSVPYALYAEKSGLCEDSVASQWNDCDEGIYYNEGNVGIGTSFPTTKLQIEGESEGTSNRRFLHIRNNSTDNLSCVAFWMNAGEGNSSTFISHHADSYTLYGNKYAGSSLLWNEGSGLFLRTKPEGKFIFETLEGSGDPYEIMRLTGDGKLGIGTDNPESNVQIEGTSSGTSNRRFLQLKNNSNDDLSCVALWLNAGSGNSSTFISHHAGSYSLYGNKYKETSLLWNDGLGLFFRTNPEGNFIFETYNGSGSPANPVEIMRVTGDGRLGIGTETPQRSLHVVDVMRLEPRLSAPENPEEGDLYMDGSDHHLKVFDGELWQSCW